MWRVLRSRLTPLLTCLLVLGVLLSAYVMVQQALRHSADIPPQLTARALADAARGGATDATTQLNPPTGTTALLVRDGDIVAARPQWAGAMPPAGALQASEATGENRVTWKDTTGTRRALVVEQVSGQPHTYALAFQPLDPFEQAIDDATRVWLGASTAAVLVCVGWVLIEAKNPHGTDPRRSTTN
ncbi:hypothetical protein [Raineyella fluvialis]|uniref:Uncharacterized protein n=1 Tax=Raineyella fluvialis TaxID=2662261 RepID=A0A5Q2F6Y6_9ACTN|nr:hypothetical protein [Raineyella fluvialis]QGF22579.1 hypothetical protein Rai3103_01540 [Raineyella fluvialis]